MAIFPIPEELSHTWGESSAWVKDFFNKMLDPKGRVAPPQVLRETPRPESPINALARIVMPDTVKEAFQQGLVGMGPMPADIALNYRSPDAIRELRRLMAAENKARGPMAYDLNKPLPKGYSSRLQPTPEFIADTNPGDLFYYTPEQLSKMRRGPGNAVRPKSLYEPPPDPLDQILRGSWFHGMRPEARRWGLPEVPEFTNKYAKDLLPHDEYFLSMTNEYGLPGSTHATPSYVRFGEPYGTSITASPSIARNFSADDYIHRVMPLYGGPPTERIIPMWRPEGAKAMNEGYNTALNELIGKEATPADVNSLMGAITGLPGGYLQPGEPILKVLKEPLTYASIFEKPLEEKFAKFGQSLGYSRPLTEQFNTLYSRALQDKGYRGILYSPQRYGEYEMLMLDPKYVKPLDYRRAGKFEPGRMWSSFAGGERPVYTTPGASKGYRTAIPEFATGTSRLSDVFNQQSWVDRINEENKRRILDLIDIAYREQVANQLFGR